MFPLPKMRNIGQLGYIIGTVCSEDLYFDSAKVETNLETLDSFGNAGLSLGNAGSSSFSLCGIDRVTVRQFWFTTKVSFFLNQTAYEFFTF